jgi:hypothetical protein
MARMWQPFHSNGAVPDDLPCIGCGYNLRKLQATGVCTECGRAVEESVQYHLAGAQLDHAKLVGGAALVAFLPLLLLAQNMIRHTPVAEFCLVVVQAGLAAAAIALLSRPWPRGRYRRARDLCLGYAAYLLIPPLFIVIWSACGVPVPGDMGQRGAGLYFPIMDMLVAIHDMWRAIVWVVAWGLLYDLGRRLSRPYLWFVAALPLAALAVVNIVRGGNAWRWDAVLEDGTLPWTLFVGRVGPVDIAIQIILWTFVAIALQEPEHRMRPQFGRGGPRA